MAFSKHSECLKFIKQLWMQDAGKFILWYNADYKKRLKRFPRKEEEDEEEEEEDDLVEEVVKKEEEEEEEEVVKKEEEEEEACLCTCCSDAVSSMPCLSHFYRLKHPVLNHEPEQTEIFEPDYCKQAVRACYYQCCVTVERWLSVTHDYNTPLHLALLSNADGNIPLDLTPLCNAPEAVVMALFEGWRGAAKEKNAYGNTPLHLALLSNAGEAVLMALFEAWPDAAKEKNDDGNTPLYLALKNKAPEAVVTALLAASTEYAQCVAYLEQGAALDFAVFMSWFDPHKEGEWLKEKDDDYGYTPLYLALCYNAPQAVVTALLEAWPDAAKVKDYDGSTPLHVALNNDASEAVAMALIAACPDGAKVKDFGGNTPLHLAAKNHASDAVVRALVAAFQGAVKGVTKITTNWRTNQPRGGGDTVLHALAAAKCSSVVEARHANTICFTLVEKRASLTATNALGQTPAEASQVVWEHTFAGVQPFERKFRHHLVASFREITAYKKRTHLSLMHFRDWTTVSHAWCTPSAKLVALTVLMVGETYKRGLLPRLPMDCWYFILNCIPRHELRQGGCEPEAEQAALTKYSAILREARARVDAAAAAAARAQ